jgi:hypothetical protein
MDSEKVISAPVSDTNSLEHGSSTDKKQEHITVDVDVDDNMDSRSELEANAFLDNKFPFPPLKGQLPEDRILTFRALFVGSALGAVISASNLYLGLKTGWTFSASLFGAILGFSIIKSVSKVLPNAWGGGHFGPKVRCCILTSRAYPNMCVLGKRHCPDSSDSFRRLVHHLRHCHSWNVSIGSHGREPQG